MGRHFTLGEASPPLGAFDAFFRWFPALKRRAGLTSPPLGAFANDDQDDHQEGLRASIAGFKFILCRKPRNSPCMITTSTNCPKTDAHS